MHKLLKEPLLHFMILGSLLYGASILWGNEEEQPTIVVSAGKIQQLTTLFTKTWQRSPTHQELSTVVQAYVLEQAAYYQGVNLGLDKNDVVITRRIKQKLDFIAEESKLHLAVSDQKLAKYLSQNQEKFMVEPKIAIRQIFLDPNRNKGSSYTQVQSLLTELKKDPNQNISKLGNPNLFKDNYPLQPLSKISDTFGEKFAKSTDKLALSTWYGPIKSSFGEHLIYVENKQAAYLPPLADIKPIVLRDWENNMRKGSLTHYYDELLKSYPVIIEWPTNNALLANSN